MLDLLRFLAALAVVLYHYTARNHSQWGVSPAEAFPVLSRFTAYGFLGVPLFFVISGFVIFMSAEGRTVGQFVAARVARLYPAYWVAVIATSVLVTFIAPHFEMGVSGSQFLVNLTMMQEAFGVDHVDGVYWTLWVEMLFYIMIALLIRIRMTEGRVLAFAFLWPLLGGLALTTDNVFLSELLIPRYASLFAVGMMLYLIHSRGHNMVRWIVLAFNAVLAAYQTVTHEVMVVAQENTQVELSSAWGFVLVFAVIALVGLVTVTPLKYVGWKWMVSAGALTYPLYLVHALWGWWIIGIANPEIGKWPALAAAIAFSLVFACVIERFVERPLRPRIRAAITSSFDSSGG